MYHPVDRGWAWVITTGAFGVHFMTIGYLRSFGILFLEFQTEYDLTSTMTSSITGVQSTSYCLFTLLAMTCLVNRYQMRSICIVGVGVQFLSVALSSFTTSFVYLILTQGILNGVGHALLYYPSLLILSQYFDKKRPLATSIAACGVSIGGATFPHLTRALIRSYGLQGALLLLSGMLLHQLPCVLIYTPLTSYNPRKEKVFLENGTSAKPLLPETGCAPQAAEIHEGETKDSLEVPNNVLINSTKLIYFDEETKTERSRQNSVSLRILSRSCDLVARLGHIPKPKTCNIFHSNASLSHAQERKTLKSIDHSTGADCVSGIELMTASMPNLFVANGSSVQLRHQHEQQNHNENRHLQVPSVDVKNTSMIVKNSTSMSCFQRCQSVGCTTCGIPSVMCLPSFWVLAVFFITAYVGTQHPVMFLPSLVEERGLSKDDAVFFLMMSSLMETFGRLLPGLILHFSTLRPSTVLVIPTLCCALVYNLTPFFRDFGSLLTFTLIYGLMSCSFWVTQTLIVIEILGMERLASCMGFFAVFMGVSSGISYPFGGFLYDATGTYATTFHFHGCMYIMSVLALVVLRVLERRTSTVRLSKGAGSTADFSGTPGNSGTLDPEEKPISPRTV